MSIRRTIKGISANGQIIPVEFKVRVYAIDVLGVSPVVALKDGGASGQVALNVTDKASYPNGKDFYQGIYLNVNGGNLTGGSIDLEVLD